MARFKLPIRQPTPCGDGLLEVGRTPLQMGWYRWLREWLSDTVLDVGAGMGDGTRLLRALPHLQVLGIEVDSRLASSDVHICPIEHVAARSWDWVLAIDVIEHVVEDQTFFEHLCRVARRGVVLTTPNEEVSHCGNHHHCREYTVKEFERFFQPDLQWVSHHDDGSDPLLMVSNPRGGTEYPVQGGLALIPSHVSCALP